MTTIYFPNGGVARLGITPLHRRHERGLRAYSRPTDWLASAGCDYAWGRTRREAVAELLRKMGASLERPLPDSVVRFRR